MMLRALPPPGAAMAVATVLALLSLAPRLSAASPALEPAWQRVQARAERPALPLLPALEQAFRAITPEQAAALDLPEAREALAATLAAAGAGSDEQAVLVPGIIGAAREAVMHGAAWQEPVIAIGAFTLTVPQLRFVVGPREGRDRAAVAVRLRRTRPAEAASHSDGELIALVPDLVAAADAASVERLLALLHGVMLGKEAEQ